ncbi:hypothetical protein KFL_003160070 [Klebsormidium nitens]|uniref:O-methyltransferase n=1 Tax=Klebsormidium nitens TaxID=105231 RepID=A0A1Y1I7B7_KLENI|nr:hypothetical protein KFL_003160070 [Klebsormidium nitens]|eukprot:GAQ86854.1 hypothetical protein KFL_003160070 [Klebsormidium nitens]
MHSVSLGETPSTFRLQKVSIAGALLLAALYMPRIPMAAADPFRSLYNATKRHRSQHGCLAYTFEDGPNLVALVQKLRPNRVLELGTALGYTACIFSTGRPTTKVDTVERDPEHVRLARENVASVGLTERVKVIEGDFNQVLPKLPAAGYDVAFFDGYAPSMDIIDTLRTKLSGEGTLICGNLGLVSDSAESRRLSKELADKSRWLTEWALEGGATAVAKKVNGQQ